MTTATSSLEIRLIDDVSPAAKAMAAALKSAEAQAKAVSRARAKALGEVIPPQEDLDA